jgi:hypothetical protein
MSLLIDVDHPNLDHIAHRHHIVRTFDITASHLADVYQAAVLEANIYEGAKVNDIQDRPF